MTPQEALAWYGAIQAGARIASEAFLLVAKACRQNERVRWVGRAAWALGVTFGAIGFGTPSRLYEVERLKSNS